MGETSGASAVIGTIDPWCAEPAAGPDRRARALVGTALGSALLGGWAPVVVAFGFGPSQRRSGEVLAVAAVVLASALVAAPSWWWRAAAVIGVAAVAGAGSHGSLGWTPALVVAAGVTIASAAIGGWGLLPGHGRLASTLARPEVLALMVTAGAGAVWRRTSQPAAVGALFLVSAAVLVAARIAPAPLGRFDTGAVRVATRAGAVVAGLVVFLVALPLLWLPGLLFGGLTATTPRTRVGRSSWRRAMVGLANQRRDAAFPFASADKRVRRRQVAGGIVVGALLVGGLVAVIRSQPPHIVRVAVDTRGLTTGEPTVPNERPYSSLPAGAGLAWADQVQRDKDALLLPPGPAAGYGTANYSSPTINIRDGERRTRAPRPCSCTPTDVWFVGGSAAFGSGQRDDHTIASDLVGAAGARGQSIRVHNLAVPGFTLWQEYQIVLARLARGQAVPRVVVFYDGFNDLSLSFTQTILYGADWNEPVVKISNPAVSDPVAKLAGFSPGQLARALDTVGGPAGLGTRAGRRYADLAQLVTRLLGAHGIDVEFFLQPDALATPVQRAAGWDAPLGRSPGLVRLEDDFAAMVNAAVGHLPSTVHDLRGVFDGYPRPVFFDSVHTNEDGAGRVAAAMYRVLGPILAAAPGGVHGG